MAIGIDEGMSMTRDMALELRDSASLVTGANRGIGRTLVTALLERGARKVYATARTPSELDFDDERVIPIQLDVTDDDAVSAAARRCGDVAVLINNAGAMLESPFLTPRSPDAARIEMEVNYFGTLAMTRAFAPILAANGGGALVNVLSVASFYSLPFNASYCASKAAAWSLTNAVRLELHGQGTNVIGVHPGFVDTDMTTTVTDPKLSPADVAAQILDAVESGSPEVLTDDRTRTVKRTIPDHLTTLYPDLQRRWDTGDSPWRS